MIKIFLMCLSHHVFDVFDAAVNQTMSTVQLLQPLSLAATRVFLLLQSSINDNQ